MGTLAGLPPGHWGEVESLQGKDQRRLLDLGLVPGTRVRALRRGPGGDPTAYLIRGAVIALRREQAECVRLRPHASGGRR
jgi:ferrous iron transport protein A